MCEIFFEHENNINYMTIKGKSDSQSNYQVKMLKGNKIDGILSLDIRNINNECIYYYNISGKQRVTQFYEFNKIKWNDVKNICMSISEMVNSVNEYMLDTDCILLEPSYMFIDVVGKKVECAYYPDSNKDFSDMLRCLFEYILEHYDHNTDKNELMCVYEVYQKIVHGEYDPAKLPELYSDSDMCEEDSEKLEETMKKERIKEESYIDKSKDYEQHRDYEYINDKKEYVIDSVQKEYVENELEKENNIKYILFSARIAVIMIMAYIAGTLFIPQIRFFKFNIFVSVVIVISLMFVYTRLSALTKKYKYSTKLIRTGKDYNYEISSHELQEEKIKNKQENIGVKEQIKKQSEKDINNINIADKIENRIKNKIVDSDNVNNEYEKEERSDNTMLLSDYIRSNIKDKENKCILISESKDNEDIVVDELPCIVGSMKKRCTRVIENELVSRMHMCICSVTDGGYTLEDMNSTNGTYLNEERIMPGDRKILHDGDLISIGPLRYTVEIN